MAPLRELALRWMYEPSPIYGIRSLRDRHLESRSLYELCVHPAIVQRCVSLLGPDLLLWRTKFYPLHPGTPGFPWHQDWNFPGLGRKPSLDPVENVSCWIAITESTRENGCMSFLPGEHRGKIPDERIVEGTEALGPHVVKVDLDRRQPVAMELRPGQFAMFGPGTLHSTGRNDSDSMRLGLVVRITRTSTRVYPGLRVDGQGLSLKRWRTLVIHGEDRYRLNKAGPPPTGEFQPVGHLSRALGKIGHAWRNRCAGKRRGIGALE